MSHAGCQLGECPVPVALHVAQLQEHLIFFYARRNRREIVAVPTKLQNNTPTQMYKCRKKKSKKQRERERENVEFNLNFG